MSDRTRAARVEDVRMLAMAMPHVTVVGGTKDNPVYKVGGKSFVFFRNPRPDAIDPDNGERYSDVIVFWVADDDGHPSVLVRASRLGELSLAELQKVVQDAWLARASRHRAEQWLSSHRPAVRRPPADDAAPSPAKQVRRPMAARVGASVASRYATAWSVAGWRKSASSSIPSTN